MTIWTAPRLWDGGQCFIVGGGTSVPHQFGVPEEVIRSVVAGGPASAYAPYLAPLMSHHTIGINNAYRIANWFNVIFFGDCSWYLVHQSSLLQLTCLKVTCCDRFARRPEKQMEGIKYLEKDRSHSMGISRNPQRVSWNGNSGAAAISLAAHFGVKRIILLGFDMALDTRGVSHWHGSHKIVPPSHPKIQRKRPSPPFDRHRKGFPTIAEDAKSLGIEILNASPISTITEFPKVQVKDFL